MALPHAQSGQIVSVRPLGARLADTVTVLLLTIVTFALAAGALSQYFSTTHGLEGIGRMLASPWLWVAMVAFVAIFWWMLACKTENKALRRFQDFVRGLWNGFAAIFTMPGKVRWLILTVCIWGCYFSQLYVAFNAFDFTADIVSQHTALAVLVAFVFSSLSMGVPSNGGIGPWQWSIIFALGIYGLAKGPATAFANLVMGAQTALLILLGIFTFVCIAMEKKSAKSNVKLLNSDKYKIMKQRNWRCDISPLEKELGYVPEYPLERGVKEIIAWYKKEGWL